MAITLFRRFGRRGQRLPVALLYEAIVAQARLPSLYVCAGLPDSIGCRFELLALHVVLVQRRLLDEGQPGAALARLLTERFVEDMEAVLRERGVGDLAVPKQVRRLAGELHGRAAAYGEALQSGEGELALAIAHSLPVEGAQAEPAGRFIARYAVEAGAVLNNQEFSRIAEGNVKFPPPNPDGA